MVDKFSHKELAEKLKYLANQSGQSKQKTPVVFVN